MRPANFPAVRLAQFSALISNWPNLFSVLMSDPSEKTLLKVFEIQPSEYWRRHLDFGKTVQNWNWISSLNFSQTFYNIEQNEPSGLPLVNHAKLANLYLLIDFCF